MKFSTCLGATSWKNLISISPNLVLMIARGSFFTDPAAGPAAAFGAFSAPCATPPQTHSRTTATATRAAMPTPQILILITCLLAGEWKPLVVRHIQLETILLVLRLTIHG